MFSSQSEFCGDKPKSGAKYGIPESLAILSEMGEVTDGVMDNKVRTERHSLQIIIGFMMKLILELKLLKTFFVNLSKT